MQEAALRMRICFEVSGRSIFWFPSAFAVSPTMYVPNTTTLLYNFFRRAFTDRHCVPPSIHYFTKHGKREEAILLEARVSSAAQIPAEGLLYPCDPTTLLPPPLIHTPERAFKDRAAQMNIVSSENELSSPSIPAAKRIEQDLIYPMNNRVGRSKQQPRP